MIYLKKYNEQKARANGRNIDWQFTYEEWLAWWGNDIVNRGCAKGKLVMARIGDTGPYHPDNVFKSLHENNVRDAQKGKIVSNETRYKVSIASKGKPHSIEHIKNQRESNYSWTKVIECPHCSKQGSLPNMKRWHFDNCGLIRQGV